VGRAESQKHTITRTNTHAFTQKKHIYSTRINRHTYINNIRIHRHTNRNTYTINVLTDTQTETYAYKNTHSHTSIFTHTNTRATPQAHHTYVIVGV
jgi:hypothetical protein